jgi:hypothetical protein
MHTHARSTPQSASEPSNPSNSRTVTPASELLGRCRDLDIRLWVEAGRLRYDAPAGALDSSLRGELAAHKAELLALVASAQPPDPYAHFRGPRRTRWGSLVWSDPDAPALELFGPAVPDDLVAAPVAELAARPERN